MNYMKRLFAISVLATFFVVAVSAKKDGGVYVFGASVSFSDSVVYFSEVQFVEGVKLEKGTKFLPARQHYAYELKDYMNFQEDMPGRTSFIYFSKKEAKLQKKVAKLKKKVQKRGQIVRYLGDKFKFTAPPK